MGQFTLAWIEPPPTADQLPNHRTLVQRIQRECIARQLQFNLIELPELRIDSLRDADRILFTSSTRNDYPQVAIDQLVQAQLGIPWGVVTGHWHAGSRRSGMGITTHWMQPWYRWWESWYGWLFPEWARPASLCATQFDAVTVPLDLALAQQPIASQTIFENDRQLVIVSACSLTRDAWQWMAQPSGCRISALASLEAVLQLEQSPDYLLWDDSLLTCLPESNARSQAVEQLTSLQQRFPQTALLVGLSQCYLDLWSSLSHAGASEIFVKPSHGLPLADYLYHEAWWNSQSKLEAQV